MRRDIRFQSEGLECAGWLYVPDDLAIAAYARAREPKALELLPGGHFDAYTAGSGFERASGSAANWFKKHLMS